MKKVLFYSVIAGAFFTLLLSYKTSAQNTSPYWSLAGNSNSTSTSKLGNTTSVPLQLYTKNLPRITIDTFGFVGINSAHPVSTLDVRGTEFLNGILKFGTGAHGIQFANPTTTANKAMMYMFTSGTINLPRMIIAHSPAFPNIGLQYDDNPDRFHFLSSGIPVLTIDLGSKGVGIHNPAPIYPLSFDNSLGDKISLWGNGNHYGFGIQGNILQMHTDISSSDIVFGYGQSGALTENVRMKGNGSTNFGIAAAPHDYTVFVNHNSEYGMGIKASLSSNFWEIYHNYLNNYLYLYYNDAFKGSFDPSSGSYTAVSDQRLKSNIKPMESVLDKIQQLKPSTYQFKDAIDKQFYDGFIAQDVLKVFPDLVYHNVNNEKKLDIYSMNYSGFGVIAIKGIQEQQDQMKKLDLKYQDQIQELKEEISQLKNVIDKIAPGQFQNVNAGTSLEQNSPNPARNTTSIGYSVPANNGSAQLHLIDNLGRTVKTIQLNSSGRINLDLSTLSSGTYTYSLVVDGKVVETKKLVKASD